ncbi:hypothetical protein A6768_03810 [Sphingobium yanoikuyae]|uniref:Uncharacterized protein n=1 Tax=Sphingobium yanoikuyae TaxID=13690 RepID=A0A291MVV7_SPHYA|nr:hypothetical protein A6768_03810 [Sphingobium yanoikuyae]
MVPLPLQGRNLTPLLVAIFHPHPVMPGLTRHPAFLALRARPNQGRAPSVLFGPFMIYSGHEKPSPSRKHVQNCRAAVASLSPDCRVSGAGR